MLVDTLLSKKGQSYNKWLKDEVVNAATDLLKDTDPELKAFVTDYLERKLIISTLSKKEGN